MSDSNKILLFSDYLFFSKLVELPVSIKQKDIAFFVENELESSSPISIDMLKWSYVRIGDSLLILASTSDRLAQAGHTHDEIDAALYAIPEAGLLASVKFSEGWNLVKMPKALNAIYVEKGAWKSFSCMELGAGEFSEQCAAFAKENKIDSFKLYAFDGFSQGSFSSISVSLKGVNCDSIKTKFKATKIFATLDIRDEAFLKELRSRIVKAQIISCMIKVVPLILIGLIALQFKVQAEKQDLAVLEAKVAILAPQAKQLQDLSDQVSSAKNFSKSQLFNALLIARLNDLRPEGLIFSKTKASSATHMEIAGTSTSLSLLNEYVSLLKEQEYISEIKSESSSKSGSAKFKLVITFKEETNV